MKAKQINWGIIGCGNVTEVKSGPAFNKVPHSRLVAVMRRQGDKAKDYAQRHGVPKWFNDASALIHDAEVNAVYIATPPDSHEEYALAALQAGKPVYLEKPMALNAAAAERIVTAVRKTGIKLSVAHYRRRQPLFCQVKTMLEQKAIGEVRMVNLQFSQGYQSDMIAKTEEDWRLNPAISGGGLFNDLAPHQLDLMRYFFGKAKKATGLSFNAAGFYKADDTVAGQILFDRNILFNGTWCFTSLQKKDECKIIGAEGTILFSIFENQPLALIKNGAEEKFRFDALPHVQEPMIENVVDYFMGNATNPCSAEEGLEVMQLMEAFTCK